MTVSHSSRCNGLINPLARNVLRRYISTPTSTARSAKNQLSSRTYRDGKASASSLWASPDSDSTTTTTAPVSTQKTIESEWNVAGLIKETNRQTLRCHKKVGKANTRYKTAMATVEELTTNPDATLEELEACPNIDELETSLQELQTRLQGLNRLESLLGGYKGPKKNAVLPLDIAQVAVELELNDAPPVRTKQPNKKKQPSQGKNAPKTRLPYRKYYTSSTATSKTEIRVGKQAEDNDELSCNPLHRDGADWWMHASGCPGSHVVIRCTENRLEEEVVQDAAALAARQSKCTGNVIQVSLTRCRDVSKPRGAKAGLVRLNGTVRTISVNMNKSQTRLDRLDETVEIN